MGTKLLEYAEEWAKSQGFEKLFVVAYWGNKQAINFYKKNDFYEIALQMEKKI
ncbi:GNAT family N-acetyltransferase [candidate division WWE3 bacterium]|uniref:GNAT family N-acetyltransferase n=1 Tax=candidate division WWE3 bacterium TaxID=2053526 RepID=A0A955RS69_UNCKA|nr:GNAT family N-acetyltransferase [candidate division WWE3 bacterium]